MLEAPEAFPIRGLFDFKMFQDDILNYYGLKDADERRGVSTGWNSVDEYYRVVPGELTIVTGVPNSGKSEWIDALLYNIRLIRVVLSFLPRQGLQERNHPLVVS